MADSALIEILKQGSEVWNRWRELQPKDVLINLSGANLSGAHLSAVDLSSANLFNANLFNVNLSSANLFNANLSSANLFNANLSSAVLFNANLSNATFFEAILFNADLRGVSLRDANLRGASLSGANLRGASLQDTRVGNTIFARIDLREVRGLSEIKHNGPSLVELYSIQLPQDGSALHFLRGCGVPDEWIDDYRARMMHPIQYHSCFISYSSKDEIPAKRLHADLQAQGVRCWFAPHDMKIGDKIRSRIDEAIHLQDKLLLILSKASVTSDWVEHEVETALARERREKRTILFPIRLDNTILEREHLGWAALVQHERHIGDFTHWTDPQAYNQAFERLLHDLKAQK